ncbi:hypothetical protein FIBSPDRAFT_966349 [Athelia psychrophila]|uniref:Uncharacterized protein n=1 Tax=Athelia psychrophila TaxID=1759441 RepID=A0A167WW87_9AGAM|nr:hypothetical protein FIBSPDRAFT_966349 [Fibularhizoctonia sp. CBS 109695]
MNKGGFTHYCLINCPSPAHLPPDAADVEQEQGAKGDGPGRTPGASTINLVVLPPHEPLGRIPADVLDLDVQVSAGRWAVEGQTLRWWYPVPTVSEGQVEYTIEIRRRGDVIKTAGEPAAEAGWLDVWCPTEGCCVM